MTLGPDGFVEFDDLTEGEKAFRALMRNPKEWQKWCREVHKRWEGSARGILARRLYEQRTGKRQVLEKGEE